MQPHSSVFFRDIIGVRLIHMELVILQQTNSCKVSTANSFHVNIAHLTAVHRADGLDH